LFTTGTSVFPLMAGHLMKKRDDENEDENDNSISPHFQGLKEKVGCKRGIEISISFNKLSGPLIVLRLQA